jgi:hypothetical protein
VAPCATTSLCDSKMQYIWRLRRQTVYRVKRTHRYFPSSRISLRCALIASLMSLHLRRMAPSASASRVYAGYSIL